MNSATKKTIESSEQSNNAWQVRKENAIARGQGNIASVYVDRALGSEIWDVEGKRYIDFGTGIAVCSTGHMHAQIRSAVLNQLDRFSHTCVMVTPYDSAVELAETLNDIVPGPSPKKTVFVTTGAEAVENSVKIARAHTCRSAVVAFGGGFHGRTLLTMGMTGKIAPYKQNFGPFPADIYHAPFPNEYHGISAEESLAAVDTLFRVSVDSTDVAAIVVEPVQGEGGFYPAPDEFLRALRSICDQHGIVFIVDEVQTGFARTGRLFCSEYSGIEPDIMTIAKGMAGGFPLAAVVGKTEIMDAPLPGGLGGTYGGSPIGCSAALAVIDIIRTEELSKRAIALGELFGSRMRLLQKEFPERIGEVRASRGAMIAIELVHCGDVNQPDATLTKQLVGECAENGLILLSCGMSGNVVRFLPALTMTDDIANEGLAIFVDAFRRLAA